MLKSQWKGEFTNKQLLSTGPKDVEFEKPDNEVFALTPIGKKIELCKIAGENKEQHLILAEDDNLRIATSAVDYFPNKTIPFETHKRQTQFVIVAQGKAKITVRLNKNDPTDETNAIVDETEMFVIPHNTEHRIMQVGKKPLKIISMYSTTNE